MCCNPRRICGMSSRDLGFNWIEPMSTLSRDICGLSTLRMGFAESKFSEDDPHDSCRGDHPKLEFTYENDVAGAISHVGFSSQKLESSRPDFKVKPLTRKAFWLFVQALVMLAERPARP